MSVNFEREKKYYTEQAEIIPNKILLLCMLCASVVVAISWMLTEVGAFRVDASQMRKGAALALMLLSVPQFFRLKDYTEKPFVKYILLLCVSVVMYIVTTFLMFHTTLCLILPMLTSTFYSSRKMCYYAIGSSLLISILSPVSGFIHGLWDSLFLQVLLQFCGFDSTPALEPFFTVSESVAQIILYIVLPRVMVVSLIGVATMNIVNGNVQALDDRIAQIRTNEQITAMQKDTLNCLASMIECRDGNTGAHVINTRCFMQVFADYILSHNLYSDLIDRCKAEKIVDASVLHDIGKISVSDTILNKPGRLTEEEYRIMQTHCLEGDKMISKAFSDNPDELFALTAHEIVTFHHEKMNGKGYPYGLAGDEIPLAARMMAIVDAFDAITSERVYKEAQSVEKAFAILREDSGTHFDGKLVEAFIASYQEAYLKQ